MIKLHTNFGVIGIELDAEPVQRGYPERPGEISIGPAAGDALAEARLEATVGRARADAQLRLNSIEAQLLAARLADPPAAPDDADTVSGLAATLAGADGAISAVHRLDQDGRGLTLVRAPGGWRPTQPSRDTPPPWLAAALGARGGSPVGWIAPSSLSGTGEARVTAFTRWPGRDGRVQVLAFELQLAPLLEPVLNHAIALRFAGYGRTQTLPD